MGMQRFYYIYRKRQGSDGLPPPRSFEKGHHESYVLSADNAQETVDWIRAIRSNVVVNPYKQLMELAKEKSKKSKKQKKGGEAFIRAHIAQ